MHTFEGFKPFQKYELMMTAFNSGGTGPASDEQSFQTKEDGMISSLPTSFPNKKKI